jgi:tRNA(Ile)-lysidine synthase
MSTFVMTRELLSQLARLPAGAMVVGFSGGLDSSVLLHALAALAPARQRGLRALHVDHGLQTQSGQWATHCERVAAELGVPFEQIAIVPVVAAGNGIEAAARAARYRALGGAMRSGEILATAQHADDQAETVLLKLLRGAGPEGLGGMRALRRFDPGYLWRPLLDVPRARLLDYAQAHALHWIEDPSNDDTRLRRNFLRREILPHIARRWPDATAAIAHSARWARAAADFIEQEARGALARLQEAEPATLASRGWLDLPQALRDPVLRLWLRSLGLDEPAHFHVAELERQLRSTHERALCVRWNQCEVRAYREILYAMHPLVDLPHDWRATWDGAPVALPAGGSLALRSNSPSADTTRNGSNFMIGYRRGGERIKPYTSAHTRELRLLLQEAGVPPWLRDRIPLIHAGDELIAVGDLFISARGRELLERRSARIEWLRAEG